jgi:hypothetical protein
LVSPLHNRLQKPTPSKKNSRVDGLTCAGSYDRGEPRRDPNTGYFVSERDYAEARQTLRQDGEEDPPTASEVKQQSHGWTVSEIVYWDPPQVLYLLWLAENQDHIGDIAKSWSIFLSRRLLYPYM